MDKVLRGMTWRQCLVYIDDILVYAKSWEEHLANLDAVLDRVINAGLKLKPGKSLVGTHEVNYLGFCISNQGVRPSPAKVAALLATEPPQTPKKLNSFLCGINYYRGEIPNFSEITADLFEFSRSTCRILSWDKINLICFCY